MDFEDLAQVLVYDYVWFGLELRVEFFSPASFSSSRLLSYAMSGLVFIL